MTRKEALRIMRLLSALEAVGVIHRDRMPDYLLDEIRGGVRDSGEGDFEMTRDDIIRMAQKAGFPGWWLTPPEPERQHGELLAMLERFAALVAAAERRAIVRAAAEIGRNMKCPY